MIICRAPAKVNLTLEVLDKRPDGFHEIRSVMQAVDLYDTLRFEKADSLTLVCNDQRLQGPDNLVLRAAGTLREIAGCREGAAITLQKEIPAAAGLGGGSSDAAATLKALNTLWRLGLADSDLSLLAAQLGSDVPFFLRGGTALAEGRGDVVKPLQTSPEEWLLLLPFAGQSILGKTSRLYASLKPEWYTTGEYTRQMVEVLCGGQELSDGRMYNVFENVAPHIFPGLSQQWQRVQSMSGRRAHLSGSGPASFVLCREEDTAVALRERLNEAGVPSIPCRTIARHK